MLESHQPHFKFSVNGKQYVYCYMRKNACSSWKRFITRESPFSSELSSYETPMKFLGKYHKIFDEERIKKIPSRIVVLRDPMDRVVSGFLNQYVRNLDRPTVLHDMVSDKTGIRKEKVSFLDFVSFYLMETKDLDLEVHFIPQYCHMNDAIEYNKVWKTDDLYEEAKREFGEVLAGRYFKSKVNDTAYHGININASEVASEDLFTSYASSGSFPDKGDFLTLEVEELVSNKYSRDISIINNITCTE